MGVRENEKKPRRASEDKQKRPEKEEEEKVDVNFFELLIMAIELVAVKFADEEGDEVSCLKNLTTHKTFF